jgi:hypothetical protein
MELKFRQFNSETNEILYFTLETHNTKIHKFHDTTTQFIGIKDIYDTEIYVGDIVKWFTGTYTVEDKPADVILSANQAVQNWVNAGRIGDFDYEGNGWSKKYSTGIVVMYNGCFGVHNELTMDNHIKNSKYNGVSWYGNIQSSKNYEIIGNKYLNVNLLN